MSVECAILFADVTGSTELYEQRGDDYAQQVLGRLLDALSGVVQTNHGTVIKYIGDEVMARFPDANSCVQAAIDMQETATHMEHDTGCRIKVGCHYGSVIESADDIFGDAVNTAARMAGISKGGQIVTTDDMVKHLAPAYAEGCQLFDRTRVKGKADLLAIYTVIWEEEDEVTTIHSRVHDEPVEEDELVMHLSYGTETKPVSSKKAFTIGRGPQCDLTVRVGSASREHAKIEYRNGKFLLSDQSTNGTYVRTQDANLMYLRREEMVLWGDGVISLGADFDEESSHIYFESP